MPKQTPEYTLTLTKPQIACIRTALKNHRNAAASVSRRRFKRLSTTLARFDEACWLAEPANEAAKEEQDK